MSVKLLPFILILVVGCNEDKTRDNLRDEVERKDLRNSTLEKQVAASEQAADEARLSLAQTVADNNVKVAALEQNVAEKNLQVLALEENLAEKTKLVSSIEVQIGATNQTIKNLEKTIQESESQSASLRSTLDTERKRAADEKSSLENDLAEKKLALANAQSTLEGSSARETELKKNVDSLTVEVKTKADEIVKLDEKIKAAEASASVPAIKELINKLEDSKKELASLKEAKEKAEVGLAALQGAKDKVDLELLKNSAVFSESMAPLWGMYLSRRTTLTFEQVKCREYVYVQSQGASLAAIVCEDGRMQWEKRSVRSFAAVNDLILDSSLAFQMKVSSDDASCKTNESTFKTALSYSFDRGSRFGASDLATSLHVAVGQENMILDSASLDFTSNECEDLEALKASGTVKDSDQSAMLDGAVKVCAVANATQADPSMSVGCFTPANGFVK